jgi:hypothetical protein
MEPEPYNLIITGGTGARQGAIGGGQITVSPSLSGSTSREPWSFNLHLIRQMRNPDTPTLLAEVSGTSNSYNDCRSRASGFLHQGCLL